MELELNNTIKENVMVLFNYLHTHAEISMKETQTTAFIKKKLEEIGYRTQTFDDCPGVIGEIGSGKPVVSLRADMDALWQKVHGKLQANHSCGHDAHMSMVLGAAMLLKEQSESLDGTVRLVFQPAEEIGRGALELSRRGVLDDADYFYGVHVRPIEETQDGHARPAILHGACGTIRGVIDGEDAHGARPHLGTNAIEVAASIVHALGHLHVNPMIPSSVKMTNLHAGSATNIIPGHAEFSLDVRAQNNEVMSELKKKIRQVVQGIASSYGVSIHLDDAHGSPAAVSDPKAIALMSEAIKAVLGEENCDPASQSSGGDDFHQYAIRTPELKSTMLGLGCDLKPGLHHPYMTFNHEAMYSGTLILATAVIKTFEEISKTTAEKH
ncbi:M20 peptidase aminoacylase family protein [Sporolactobacillus sp. CPB3-1]|uniref:M20 peptidase aminoacylase family protein n=1 Tax=Sporolactobacillus mangiferae TaxID=2940498 RepID=A0ABT0M9L8_9BACL|nr:M20 peptidase aminoacylase family protein [Sporolactobacillus mangiferae]MCL1631561.1 M20 peptidase aminoacylase family protein [Sporolactobacillus mangiferae]